jgi:hypothetical protein
MIASAQATGTMQFSRGEYESFKKAALPVIRDIDECEDTYRVENGTATPIAVGKGQQAVIFQMTGACICGATGNCPLILFVKVGAKYRAVVREFGWDYRNGISRHGVPEISFVSNFGAELEEIVTYSYFNGKFFKVGTRRGSLKDGKDWWEPDSLTKEPSL